MLISCNQSPEAEETTVNEITGQAVAAEIMRACKYPDGKFCEEICCQAEEKCKDGSFAFMECDLKSGEWMEKAYADSECSSECETAKELVQEGIKENKALKSCPEGWKCLNRFERIYRNSDCSFGETEKCSTGCVNDTCANLCAPDSFSCRKDILRKCDEDGSDWRYHMTCDYGCKNNACINQENSNQTQNATQDNDYLADECISIINFNYDAAGKDNNSNLNDEYFTIKNACSYSIDIGSWIAKDIANHKFIFPAFNLDADEEVTIHTGSGTADATNLYWGSGSHIWNNNGGDTLYLNTSNGTSVLIYSYP
ncbi:lamin tail domain-containing protein [Candidatus Woesearchaeota archaeon]|nr:lamin tail domain-containing protein [Candidatus Woesearchaeota archaeon]